MKLDLDGLRAWVADAGQRARALVADLSPEQLTGPYLPIINPLRWEVAHAAFFYSFWVLRAGRGGSPVRADEDTLFDSIKIGHSLRWTLPLPGIEDTFAYVDEVHRRVIDGLSGRPVGEREAYLTAWGVFHEDMHGEAFTYSRQTLGYPAPRLPGCSGPTAADRAGALAGDAEVPGGRFHLGAGPGDGFVFDNEKWAHEVEVRPFRIARAAVSQREVAAFADDGGYRRPELWSPAGWAWRTATGREQPRWWRRGAAGWERRDFDRWLALEPDRAAIHLCWYEADAFCRWAGRRLPTELEWEVAAAGEPDGRGGLAAGKRRWPWGDPPPSPERANLDARALGTIDVGALPAGDSAFGCRQMIGNAWEWTASAFAAYPGFEPDMYSEYSAPWFGSHKVLRGGAWATRSRLIRTTWRNFYTPDRDDVLAGFRTCAP